MTRTSNSYVPFNPMFCGATSPPSWLSSGRIPGLDGLRAVAISLVLVAHGSETAISPIPSWLGILAQGGLGVDIFFVISGFLITLLMLREFERTGTISLIGFYSRRTLRIVPAYLAYLGFVFLLTRLGLAQLRPIDWAAALTFTMNLLPNLLERWEVGHVWSLSVEEHFYLAWPITFVLLGPRSARLTLMIIVACAPVIRYTLWAWLRDRVDIDFFTLTRFDTIGVGCLLAFLTRTAVCWDLARRSRGRTTWGIAASVGLLAFSMAVLSRSGKYEITMSRTVEAAAIAAIVFFVTTDPDGLACRLLSTRPMVAVGVLSYSLYLWQQPFLHPGSSHWFTRFPTNALLTLTAAVASFRLVERPFLMIKDRAKG